MLVLLLPLTPILWLLASLGYLKWPAHKACPAGLLLSLVIAVSFWGTETSLAMEAAAEGAIFALIPILWVIVAAFFAYNLSLQTGSIIQIKTLLTHLSGDRRIQALIIAWGFGGFMESIAGFGTAVAVPAALLISLGFEPFRAAKVCLLANTVAVAFGVIGIPVTTLARITDLPVGALSTDIGIQLTPFIFIVPLVVVYSTTGTLASLRGVWLITLVAGASFGLTQFFVAHYVGPELPAIAASLVSSASVAFLTLRFPPVPLWRFPNDASSPVSKTAKITARLSGIDPRSQLIAWLPYLLLLLLVLCSSRVFPAMNNFFSQFQSFLPIYTGAGSKPLVIDWFLTPGTLVLLSAVGGGLIQGASLVEMIKILGATVFQLRKTAVTVISIVSMAKVLGYSGMIESVAVTLAAGTGFFYPALAPAIGALGTFITGSDTSSNILFGLLQKQTALQLNLSPVWLAAANTSGACIGKLISPQSISIAAAATGLIGKEGDLLSVTFRYAAVFLIGLGGLTLLFAR